METMLKYFSFACIYYQIYYKQFDSQINQFTSIYFQTYNVDQLTPDSAGTATALLSGVKNNHGMIGVSQKAIKGKCSTLSGNKLKSLLDYSDKEGGLPKNKHLTHIYVLVHTAGKG